MCYNLNSRIIQQQDNRVELFSGSVISSERNYEVIKAIPCSLSRHDDELVFKPICFGIFKTVVPAALRRRENGRYIRFAFIKRQREKKKYTEAVIKFKKGELPTLSSRRQQNGAFSANRWHKVGELPM